MARHRYAISSVVLTLVLVTGTASAAVIRRGVHVDLTAHARQANADEHSGGGDGGNGDRGDDNRGNHHRGNADRSCPPDCAHRRGGGTTTTTTAPVPTTTTTAPAPTTTTTAPAPPTTTTTAPAPPTPAPNPCASGGLGGGPTVAYRTWTDVLRGSSPVFQEPRAGGPVSSQVEQQSRGTGDPVLRAALHETACLIDLVVAPPLPGASPLRPQSATATPPRSRSLDRRTSGTSG